MNLKLEIPEALKPNFQRVYRRVPVELRQHEALLQDLILFLKVGGERLARQHLEVAKNDLKLVKTAQRKERRKEAMRRTAAAAAENQAAGEDDAENPSDANDGHEDRDENSEKDARNDTAADDLPADDGDDADTDPDN